MAKGQKVYRRKYKSAKWRRFRRYNYFSAKIDISGDLVFPPSSTSVGQPRMSTSGSGGTLPYQFLNTVLSSSNNEFKRFGEIFTFFKLKGLRFEFTPTAANASLSTITHTKPVYFGFDFTQSSTTEAVNASIQQFPTNDKAFILNPLEKTTKYYSTWGMQDDYKLVTSGLAGFIGAYSAEGATDNTGPAWSYRITFYVLFKYAKQ